MYRNQKPLLLKVTGYCNRYVFRKCDSAEFVADANLLTFNLIKYLMMLVTGLSTGKLIRKHKIRSCLCSTP